MTVGGVITEVTPISGPLAGNTLVDLRGTGFSNGSDVTLVTFGDVAATIQSQNSTVVTVLAPPSVNAVSVNIVVVSSSHGVTNVVNGYKYSPCT
jgi:hypothetical protein